MKDCFLLFLFAIIYHFVEAFGALENHPLAIGFFPSPTILKD
jgi:hypothetical protein